MRLLGLDPGLRHTGWGIVEVAPGSRLRFVACGAVDSDAGDDLALRLKTLYTGVRVLIDRWMPHEAAVEETVVNKNASSSLKLGHARGVIVLAAAQAGLTVHEYASKQVKRSVTGTGAATKEQVAMMVRVLLPGVEEAGRDASDALAIAICHAHIRETTRKLARVLEVAPT